MNTDYSEVTEIAGAPISSEQLYRLHHRYSWALPVCVGRDVVECGCGTGPGIGILGEHSRSMEAGDVSPLMVETARRHYGDRYPISQFSAEAMPFDDRSKDVIILYEAIYYLPDAARFVAECARVLRPGGTILIVSANKDLWDFHPSPHAVAYYGVRELRTLLSAAGFASRFYGFQDVRTTSLKQKVFRPLKRLAVSLNLMPKTMAGKRWLKRLVFGAEVAMPAELRGDLFRFEPPAEISPEVPDPHHKIIYCSAILMDPAS